MEQNNVMQIPIEEILPNRFQPRLAFDDASLKELADSIKEHGIIQPIIIRRINDKYEIIAGERRYRAAKLAGLVSVPAIITQISDTKSAEVAIVENVQRKNLTAIEEAKSYKALLDKGLMNQEDLARKMGLSQSAISNKLRLLTLDESIQEAILAEKISERHARTLLKVKKIEDQKMLLERVLSERLSVKRLEEEIVKLQGEEEKPKIEPIKIIPKEESEADLMFPNLNKDEKVPNKFFNFLEDEAANMSVTPTVNEPIVEDEIELLDDFADISSDVSKEKNTTENNIEKEIKEFISKYPNIIIEEINESGSKILKIKIPD